MSGSTAVNQNLFMTAEAMISNERSYGEWLTRRDKAVEGLVS